MESFALSTPSFSSSVEKHPVHLRDLMVPLGYSLYPDLRKKFKTFLKKMQHIQGMPISCLYKADTYVDKDTGRPVDTFYLSTNFAKAFALWCNPAKGMELLDKLEEAKLVSLQTRVKLLESRLPKSVLTENWVSASILFGVRQQDVTPILDQYTDRVNTREVTHVRFDRVPKPGYEDIVKVGNDGKVLFDPEAAWPDAQ